MAKILILGATSRVATEVARLYARHGDQLYLVGRSAEKLTRLNSELEAHRLGHAILDACDPEASRRVIHDAWQHCNGFDITLIAHGWLGDQLDAESDGAHARAIIDVNLVSVVTQLVELQPLYRAQGHGNIAVCSSVAAVRGRPRNFCYGAAKAGVTIYLQGLRSVLWPKVNVHALMLGPVDTPMTTDHDKNFSFSTPRATATGIVRAIDRGVAQAYIPSWWRVVMFGVRHLPEFVFQRLGFLSGR